MQKKRLDDLTPPGMRTLPESERLEMLGIDQDRSEIGQQYASVGSVLSGQRNNIARSSLDVILQKCWSQARLQWSMKFG